MCKRVFVVTDDEFVFTNILDKISSSRSRVKFETVSFSEIVSELSSHSFPDFLFCSIFIDLTGCFEGISTAKRSISGFITGLLLAQRLRNHGVQLPIYILASENLAKQHRKHIDKYLGADVIDNIFVYCDKKERFIPSVIPEIVSAIKSAMA